MRGKSVNRFSTAAAIEELISPSLQISYTKHLINGQFVDAASGNMFSSPNNIFRTSIPVLLTVVVDGFSFSFSVCSFGSKK